MVYQYQPIPADSCCLSSFIDIYVGQSEMRYMSSFYFSSMRKKKQQKRFLILSFQYIFHFFSYSYNIMQKKYSYRRTYICAHCLHLLCFLLLVCKIVWRSYRLQVSWIWHKSMVAALFKTTIVHIHNMQGITYFFTLILISICKRRVKSKLVSAFVSSSLI